MVYRIRHSRWRGASWVEERLDCLWLLAAAQREEGSQDDAYDYFIWLHGRGELLPAAPDGLRLRAEAAAASIRQMQTEIGESCKLIDRARGSGATAELHQTLTGPEGVIPIRIWVDAGDVLEVWVAVSVLYASGKACPSEFRDVIWATFEAELDPEDWEWTADFPGGPLEYHERARLYLA